MNPKTNPTPHLSNIKMFRRENLRGSVSDATERRILADARSKGISKAEWVVMAAEAFLEKPKEPVEVVRTKIQAPPELEQALEGVYGGLLGIKEKNAHDFDIILGQVGKARNLLKPRA